MQVSGSPSALASESGDIGAFIDLHKSNGALGCFLL